MARDLQSLIPKPERVTVIHNGVSTDRFRPSDSGALRDTLTQGGRPIVVTVSRLEPQKALFVLIEAAELVHEATFVVVGDGSERGELQARGLSLVTQGRLKFLGSREDVPALLAACDLFVLPSLFEGLPIAVLEAMASAKPVVATRIDGTDEIVQDGVTGILVPPRDARSLADAILWILRNPSDGRRMGEVGRGRILTEFSAELMVERTVRLYEELLA
jgi:glycosyltransferase involved in cell wall biosynthesis